jgi:hypothetical protein
MKNIVYGGIVLLSVLVLAGCIPPPHASRVRHGPAMADSARYMTRQDVVSLAQAGVSDSLIVSMMDATHSYFQLTTQDVLDLKGAGVHEPVIRAMLATPPDEERGGTADDVRSRVVPPYWYLGYYPYWDPWYSTWGPWRPWRYTNYHPAYIHRSYPVHYGGPGPVRGYGGGHGGGRHR